MHTIIIHNKSSISDDEVIEYIREILKHTNLQDTEYTITKYFNNITVECTFRTDEIEFWFYKND